MPQPLNSFDAYVAAHDAGMPVRFAQDDAIAYLGNTRGWFNGTDYIESAVLSMQQWPGLVDLDAVRYYTNQVSQQQPPQTSQGSKADEPGTYDCATDSCSNGKELSAVGKPFRRFACLIGASSAGLCDPDHKPGDIVAHDGPDSGLGGWDSMATWGDKLFGIDPKDTIKRSYFVLFALVLIGVAVWALVKR